MKPTLQVTSDGTHSDEIRCNVDAWNRLQRQVKPDLDCTGLYIEATHRFHWHSVQITTTKLLTFSLLQVLHSTPKSATHILKN